MPSLYCWHVVNVGAFGWKGVWMGKVYGVNYISTTGSLKTIYVVNVFKKIFYQILIKCNVVKFLIIIYCTNDVLHNSDE